MRVFICLGILSFMVASCQGKCFSDRLRLLLKNGKLNRYCFDQYDGKRHPIWSSWRTADCYICQCRRDGMRCCERDNGVVLFVGCKEGETPESCERTVQWLDDQCRLIVRSEIGFRYRFGFDTDTDIDF